MKKNNQKKEQELEQDGQALKSEENQGKGRRNQKSTGNQKSTEERILGMSSSNVQEEEKIPYIKEKEDRRNGR
jgi:hypothetical protein